MVAGVDLKLRKPLELGKMKKEQFDAEIQKGIDSIKAGKVYSADEVDEIMEQEIFYSKRNIEQIKKADQQIADGKVIEKTMDELEAMDESKEKSDYYTCGVPDIDKMTKEQFDAVLQIGFNESKVGKSRPADEVFAELLEKYNRK